jgi:hypothetical protein
LWLSVLLVEVLSKGISVILWLSVLLVEVLSKGISVILLSKFEGTLVLQRLG